MRSLLLLAAMAALIVPALAEIDACKGNRTDTFERKVLVEHGMAHQRQVTVAEIKHMERAFKEAYNKANDVKNSEYCDKRYLRHADNVTVEQGDYFYLYENGNRLYRRVFVYTVTATGKNCDEDSTLFDVTSDDRRELVTEDSDRDLSKIFDGEGLTCSCDPDASSIRGPTRWDFRGTFKNVVNRLKDEEKLKAVVTVDDVIEMQPVPCDEEESEFEAVAIVMLSEEPAPKDIQALRWGFQDSYNEIANYYCDPLFRRVADVTAKDITDESRRLAATRKPVCSKSKNITKNCRRPRWKFRIKGRCRGGCPKKTRLFDDVSDKRSLEVALLDRRLEADDTCYCSTQPSARHAPDLGLFRAVYNRTVHVTNRVEVAEIDEQDE